MEYALVVKDDGYEEPKEVTALLDLGWEYLKNGKSSLPLYGEIILTLLFEDERLKVFYQKIGAEHRVVSVRVTYNKVRGKFYPAYAGWMLYVDDDDEALEVLSDIEDANGFIVPDDPIRFKVQKSGLKFY